MFIHYLSAVFYFVKSCVYLSTLFETLNEPLRTDNLHSNHPIFKRNLKNRITKKQIERNSFFFHKGIDYVTVILNNEITVNCNAVIPFAIS